MLDKLRGAWAGRRSKGCAGPSVQQHEEPPHGPPPPPEHTGQVALQQLPPQFRAAQEVAHHHDKAGLAPRFRVDDNDANEYEIDVLQAADITPDVFWQRYVVSGAAFLHNMRSSRNAPVVVRGAMTQALGWSPSIEFSKTNLATAVGHAAIRVRSVPEQSGTFGDVTRLANPQSPQIYQYVNMSLADYLATLHQEPVQYYAARLQIQEDLPELVSEIPSHWDLPWRRAFGKPYHMGAISYMGAGQQSVGYFLQATPLHYDDVEGIVRLSPFGGALQVFVASGAKHLQLFRPGQSTKMYPAPQRLGTHYSFAPLSALSPDTPEADMFPLLSTARCASVTLTAGDMLYLPCCWWHSVRGSAEFNCSFNYWFAQSPEKEDQQIYRAHLQQETDRWVKQLGTMDLPASVMREAYEEAPCMVDHRAKLRENFAWDNTESMAPARFN